jgi:4-amino-4-deoxy-L-arabinose transferase-like glycosyltransferase
MGSFNGLEGSDRLIDYLLDHYDNETFLAAVPSAMMGSSIILETGKPVMAIGGFSGSDPILTTDRLEKMVEGGEVRYFLTTGGQDGPSGNSTAGMSGPMGGGQTEIMSWVKAHGTLVPSEEWSDNSMAGNAGDGGMFPGFGGASQLYDLKGGR